MVTTLCAFSDEVLAAPSTNLSMNEDAAPYAFSFSIPVATTGVRFLCRPSLVNLSAASPDGRAAREPLRRGRRGHRLRRRARPVGAHVRLSRRRDVQRALRTYRNDEPHDASVLDQEPLEGGVHDGARVLDRAVDEGGRAPSRAEPPRGDDQHHGVRAGLPRRERSGCLAPKRWSLRARPPPLCGASARCFLTCFIGCARSSRSSAREASSPFLRSPRSTVLARKTWSATSNRRRPTPASAFASSASRTTPRSRASPAASSSTSVTTRAIPYGSPASLYEHYDKEPYIERITAFLDGLEALQ